MGFKFELSVVACVALYTAMQATSSLAQALLLLGPPASSGLQAQPMPDPKLIHGPSDLVRIRSTLIYYDSTDIDSVRQWTNKLDQFLKPYRKNTDDPDSTVKRRVTCMYVRNETEVCDVPVDDFHPCTSQNNYSYHRGAPCVFLKLDDTLNWSPKFVNTTEFIPVEMPEDLKQHIRVVAGYPESNTVWVSCEGEEPADVENIGPVQYIPRRGFPSYYYPFTNKEGYLSPLVAVLFERPMKGVVIMVKCKAWTRDSVRYAHFELLID